MTQAKGLQVRQPRDYLMLPYDNLLTRRAILLGHDSDGDPPFMGNPYTVS